MRRRDAYFKLDSFALNTFMCSVHMCTVLEELKIQSCLLLKFKFDASLDNFALLLSKLATYNKDNPFHYVQKYFLLNETV